MAFLRHLLLFIVTMITIIPGENRCVPPYFLNDGECYEQHGCNQDSDCDGCNVNCEIGMVYVNVVVYYLVVVLWILIVVKVVIVDILGGHGNCQHIWENVVHNDF
eukprot:125547_1